MYGPDDAEAHTILASRFSSGPATTYLGLSTTEPVLVGGVWTNFTEPASGYARQSVAASEWTTPAVRATTLEKDWPDPTADLGVIGWWGRFDASTGGAPRWVGRVAEATNLPVGTTDVVIRCRVESLDSLT